MNFFNLKALTVIGGLLLGSIFLGSTPDTIEPSAESQRMEATHKEFLKEVDAKQQRLLQQTQNVMDEHQRIKQEFTEKEADLLARQQEHKRQHQEARKQLLEDSTVESMRGKKPRIGDVEW